jgi:two-component system, OmpR family, sensor histidine kinase SenX3
VVATWSIVALLVGTSLGVVLGRRSIVRAPTRAEVPPTPGDALTSSPDDPRLDALRAAVDQLDLAVAICDAKGHVNFRNRLCTAMSGTHSGVILEGHLDEALKHALRTGHVDRRIDLRGPPRVTLELRAERLANGHAVAIIEDVSERARIDAMRTDFVTNISHELKTPVGAIAVLAETLEGEGDPSIVARISERLVNESHRAVTTIDDLLELSRIESSRVVDDVVDLDEIVAQSLARGRDVDPTINLSAIGSGTGIRVRADRRQLTSAIGNLVENAAKYSDPGGVVHVRVQVSDEFVEIEVADEGHGIPQRDLDRVFERFYRVDRARSRETGGTGLGLSIVRHVAHNHGGDVIVTSQEGEGSNFVFRLPLALLVAQRDADPGSTADVNFSVMEER